MPGVLKAAPLAAPLARRQRRALPLGRPARRTPGHCSSAATDHPGTYACAMAPRASARQGPLDGQQRKGTRPPSHADRPGCASPAGRSYYAVRSGQAAANRLILWPVPSTRAQPAARSLCQSKASSSGNLTSTPGSRGFGSCRMKHTTGARREHGEEAMTGQLDHRGWTAAQNPVTCVICGQLAVLRSPRGKPCPWTCALVWTEEHRQAEDHERRAASWATRCPPRQTTLSGLSAVMQAASVPRLGGPGGSPPAGCGTS
jgi:hypothetical protein